MSSTGDSSVAKRLTRLGYSNPFRLTSTLQGSIWKSSKQFSGANNCIISTKTVIKITKRDLHSNSTTIVNGKHYKINENILKEMGILKHLTQDNIAPTSIIKYIDSFKSKADYYLVMEDGGFCLLDFVIKIHDFIKIGKLDIFELQHIAKIIFKQTIEATEYIHSKNIAHMDISLENWLINDIDIILDEHGKIHFPDECGIRVKLCDFGLSEVFVDNNKKWTCNKFCGKSGYFSPEIAVKKPDFDAKSNDIFCLGVCFFMIIIGSAPWTSASIKDPGFVCIVSGQLKDLLHQWRKSSYVTYEIIELFNSFFRYERDRITLQELKRNKWIYDQPEPPPYINNEQKENDTKHQCKSSKSNDISCCTENEAKKLAIYLKKSSKKLRKRALTTNLLSSLIEQNIMLSRHDKIKDESKNQLNLTCQIDSYLRGLLFHGYLIENDHNTSDYISYHLDAQKCKSKSRLF